MCPEKAEVFVTSKILNECLNVTDPFHYYVPEQICIRQTDKLIKTNKPSEITQFIQRCKTAGWAEFMHHGKYLAYVTDKAAMIIHLRMTGSLRIYPLKEASDVNKLLEHHSDIRLIIDVKNRNDSHRMVVFHDVRKFGTAQFIFNIHFRDWLKNHKVGPDILEIPADEFVIALTKKGKKPIKIALLEQDGFSGVGNYMANEACWMAGINPHRPCSSVTIIQKQKILDALNVLTMSVIRSGGVSIKDFIKPDGEKGLGEEVLNVYGKKKCIRCMSNLISFKLGGRSTILCPSCQS